MERYYAVVSEQHHDIYKVLVLNQTNNENLVERSKAVGYVEAKLSGRLAHSINRKEEFPSVGDYVVVDRQDNNNGSAVIELLLPRRTVLLRREPGGTGRNQVIAANLDTAFLCMSLNNNYNVRRLERYMSLVLGAEIKPVIVLTKADLAADSDRYVNELARAYPDTEIIVCSAVNDTGIERIRELLDRGVTASFIGSSGIGKSTLTNKLAGREILKVNGIRERDQRGRHTTTHRQLVVLDNGSFIIDTPGMRQLALEDSDVGAAFDDIEELAGRCRFGDCTHTCEPGCAVTEAVKAGKLDAKRLKSYIKLKKEENGRRKKQW